MVAQPFGELEDGQIFRHRNRICIKVPLMDLVKDGTHVSFNAISTSSDDDPEDESKPTVYIIEDSIVVNVLAHLNSREKLRIIKSVFSSSK